MLRDRARCTTVAANVICVLHSIRALRRQAARPRRSLRQKQLLLKLCCFEYVINIALNTSRRARRSELGTFGCVYFCNRIYRKRRSFQITFRPQAARSRNVELSLRWAVRVRRPYATCFYFQRKVPYLGEMKQHRMEFSCMIL